MEPRSVGIVGFGSIGQSIVDSWRDDPVPANRLAVLLTRPGQAEYARRTVPPDVRVVTDLRDFLSERPQVVVEAAGHAAVREVAPQVLQYGASMMILSVGALADDPFRESMMTLASRNSGKLIIPVGAIAGLDGLLALRRSGLESVSYQSTKPPVSWKGTVAQQRFDLDHLAESTVIFEGNAADAARLYPRNANIAATVALVGLGLQQTRVRLIADPKATVNSGYLIAEGTSSRLSVLVEGSQNATNPKSSSITGLSVLSSLRNEDAVMSFR